MFGAVNSGLESGFMIAHVTAASLASENKTLAHPSSVDSISTSGGQEDIVSMAPWAGRSCLKIIENVRRILAIEILVSGNINHRFHQKYSSSKSLKALMSLLKKSKVLSKKDRVFAKDIEKAEELIINNKIFFIEMNEKEYKKSFFVLSPGTDPGYLQGDKRFSANLSETKDIFDNYESKNRTAIIYNHGFCESYK